VQELQIDILGEAHETDGLILDLGHESLAAFVLSSDKLSDEVFTIGLSDSFRLRIENISQIIVILLFGASYLNEGQDVEAG